MSDEQNVQADAAEGVRPPRLRPLRVVLLVAVAATILVADLTTKIAAVALIEPGQRYSVLGGLVDLVVLRNPGAAFSFATGLTWLLTLVAVVVVVVIARMARRLRSPGWAWGLGLVLGGALGNLVDRLFRSPGPLQGHVVDFVSLMWDGENIWPVFNVADSSIVCGGILLVALAVLGREPDGTRTPGRRTGQDARG